MNYSILLQKVAEQVSIFYRDQSDSNLLYHNQTLTAELLDISKRIAEHYNLGEKDSFILNTAASFLYTGFGSTNIDNYEIKSAELAETFLTLKAVESSVITAIKSCILSTQFPQNPIAITEKILCDAGNYYLGTHHYSEKLKLMKKELEAISGKKIDGNSWRTTNIKLLATHHYHTDYCQLLLNQTKAENLALIQNRQEEKINKKNEAELKAAEKLSLELNNQTESLDELIAIKKKRIKTVRGSETMFRLSSTNNVRISEMADNKAQIMITVNSVIISVVFGLILKNLDENRHLLIPTLLLLIVSLTTIIFAVLATRPKMTAGKFTKEQLNNKSVNLLFFGNFHNMSFEEYEEGIQALLTDQQFLYASFTKDIYGQGKVLGRKYRLLNISYTIFMYGLILAVIAYATAVIMN